MNTIRAHLSEFGIVTPKACRRHEAKGIHNEADQKTEWGAGFPTNDRLLEAAKDLPAAARLAVDMLADQLRETQEKIDDLTARIVAAQKADPLARRLATIPGLGAITASAIAATTPEVDNFSSARDYAAWLGLTPQPHSSGGKERLGRISKGEAPNAIRTREGPDNRYLRRLLYLGASCRRHAFGVTAQISARRCRRHGDDWLWRMLEKKPVKVVAIARANRMARVVWAFAIGLERMATDGSLRSGESYSTNLA